MTTFYLIPAKGLVVRDPETRDPLPAEGATKPRNRYWLRRVAEGSCTIGERPSKRARRAPAPAPEEG